MLESLHDSLQSSHKDEIRRIMESIFKKMEETPSEDLLFLGVQKSVEKRKEIKKGKVNEIQVITE